MIKAILLGLLIVLIVLAGCAKSETATGAVIRTEPEKTVQNTVQEAASDDWCNAGTDWKMASQEESASWKIDKLIVDGKYSGLCHVVYTMNTGTEETTMDYYFDKEGKNGYIEIKLPNGQVSTQEWHG